jgi:membrane-bound lytic murein transglycosylase MltF
MLFVLASFPAKAGLFPSTYDREIKAAAERWLPGIPWKVLKAQFFQESRLDPAARSSVGAEGIAQFMPATWAAIAPALGYGTADRRLAGPAIAGGAYYMAELRDGWPESLGEFGRHDHAMASYNAGPGNIRKAWRLCGKHQDWLDTAECLPKVTGRHAAETQAYILRIWRWYGAMQ